MSAFVRVLVVEDDPDYTTFIRDYLISHDYDVETLDDPRLAFSAVVEEKQPYDLLIFDVMLPGVDGLTLTKRIRQKGVMTPVLLISGGVDGDLRLNITTMGPSVLFLEKTNSKEVLLASCSDLLSRNQLMSMVYKMDARMERLENLFTPDKITDISSANLNLHCPRMHSRVKDEIHRSRSEDILQVQETFKEEIHREIHEATEELGKKIEDATSVSTLLRKAKDNTLVQIALTLMCFIGTAYIGFAGYSYNLADSSSRQVIEIRSEVKQLAGKLDDQKVQISRIEDLLKSGSHPSAPTTPPTTPGGTLP